MFTGILCFALDGCANSGAVGELTGGTTSAAGGTGGRSVGSGGASGGAAGTGGSASGGTVSTSGATGGSVSTGGSPHTGGSAGETSGAGGRTDSGTGGSGQMAGRTGTSGRAGASGQAGSNPSGGAQTGGRTGGGQGPGGSELTGGSTGACGPLKSAQRSVSFGTLLDPKAVMCAAQQLAKSLANPSSSQWRAKGDQHRKYRFPDANTDEPYRLYVPTGWDGKSSLPLAMFLHGSGSDENSYVEMNDKQMLNHAQEHGYLLVAPLGDKGAYGNFLRLSAPFGKADEAAKLMAQVTADSERTNELSEQDVINVLELILAEYPIDRSSMFLFGHSMGSGGTWYIGGKYASYWRGLAPMSGPFVQETGYPWDDVRATSIFVTEGTQTPSLDGSRVLRDWLKTNGFSAEYKEVNADHGGMIRLVLPDIFDFFDRLRAK